MLKQILVMLLFVVVAQGCHGKRRRKRQIDPLNDFFGTCMSDNGVYGYTWPSVVDFVINQNSWYLVGQSICDLSSPNDAVESQCWWDKLLFQLTEPDRAVARQCVCEYFESKNPNQNCTAARKRRKRLTEIVQENSKDCPYVSVAEYARRVRQANIQIPDDRTLNGSFVSVINYVRREGLCIEGYCNCTLTYTSTADDSQLPCESCWPTRLYSMVRDDSPLKPVLLQITTDLETLGAPC